MYWTRFIQEIYILEIKNGGYNDKRAKTYIGIDKI